VRIYSASSEETLRARNLLKDWTGEGYLTKDQYKVLEQETVSELRTTNIFLRLVLFLFAVISVGAAAGLFFVVFLSHPSEQTAGVVCIVFASVCYAAAEGAVSQARLYRYGIEEALAVCSVGFLCGGLLALFSGNLFSSKPDAVQFLVPAAGAVFSLWIWRRFGFSYAFLAAMIFALFLPGYWTSSHSGQHVMVAAFYAAGLAGVAAVRSRHRFDYLDEGYSLVEAMLWLGIYLAINLQLSSLELLSSNLPGRMWGGIRATPEFTRPFYWGTWVLIWCLPPIVLARGFRQKDRSVIAVGAIVATLTLVSNKPYRLAAAYLGPDVSGHIVNCYRRLHPTLACPWPGRNSPRLYRRTPFGKGQTLDERRVECIGSDIAAVANARTTNKRSGRPLRWGTFRGRRRKQRFLNWRAGWTLLSSKDKPE
jgi:hypothetical protein